jgi:peptide/nickel transport system substrate-binding protein
MKLHHKSVVAFALLAMLAAPVAAKNFRWAFQSDAVTMDPYNINETMTLGFLGNLYEGLIRRNENFEVEPALATEWSTPEPTKWVFQLRQGVKFHNGNAFTADDVIFSYQRASQKSSDVAPFVAGIKAVNKIDDYTVEVMTDGPRPILLNEIGLWYILDKEWAEANNATQVGALAKGEENFATVNANGTGPFMLKLREPDVQTVLVRNPNYWGDISSNITEANFTPIKSAATRVASFLSGELDMMYPVPLQDVARINNKDGLQVIQNPEVRTIFLGMDQANDELKYSDVKGKNPFKDLRVRRAFYQAIDIEAIHRKVMRGASKPTGLMIGKGINGFDESLNGRYPYDPNAAKKLLADAGYPNGFGITFDCPNDRYVNDEAICQAITAMLAKVGIKANLNAQTKAKHFEKLKAMDSSFFLLGWTPGSLDMHNTFFYNAACPSDLVAPGKTAGSGQASWNTGRYCSHKLDALLEQIAVEVDPAKRLNLMGEAMKLHKEEIGHLPLHQQALAWGVKDAVNLVQNPDNTFTLRFVVLK